MRGGATDELWGGVTMEGAQATAVPPVVRRRGLALRRPEALGGAGVTLAFFLLWYATGTATGGVLRGRVPHMGAAVGGGARRLAVRGLQEIPWYAGPLGYLVLVALLAGTCLPVIRRLGAVRGPALWLAGHLTGALAGMGVLVIGRWLGDGWSLSTADAVAAAPVGGAAAVTMAWSRQCPPRWRLRLRLGVLLGVTVLVLWRDATNGLIWLVSALCGLAIGARVAPAVRVNLPHQRGEVERVRRLLARHGGTTVSYMSTWRGNRYWFTADGRAVVTYRLMGHVALTVSDPVGDPAAVPGATAGFAEFCAGNGWTPCWYSVTEGLASGLADHGWKLLQVAEDARIPLPHLKFTGRRWQDVRTALNRARREGTTAQWISYPRAAPAVAAQIRAISAAWTADKGTPEMTFTLGGIEELCDEAVRCLVAVDNDGRIRAVTSWLPVHRDGVVVGWTLDMMRRLPQATGGVMEFLIASAALRFQEEGAQFLSLSGTPLTSGEHRLLRWLGAVLEPVWGYRALRAFKAKFQPVYHPLYLAYPRPSALPGIAVAIGRAYLPGVGAPQLLRLAKLAVRGRHRDAPRPTTVDSQGEASWVRGHC